MVFSRKHAIEIFFERVMQRRTSPQPKAVVSSVESENKVSSHLVS